MASLLPNLSAYLLPQTTSSSKGKLQESTFHHTLPQQAAKSQIDSDKLSPISSLRSALLAAPRVNGSPVSTPADAQEKQQKQQRDEFYVNIGLAVRTLREDMPLIFTKDLNYDIYRDDITFTDPLNTFAGIENYKLIFWALRFHGKILFRAISFEVYRIWQPSENMILVRWNLRGIPRVPWEAKGEFQGTSRYNLDRSGKIYEHKVDNLAFNFPQQFRAAYSILDFVGSPASPNLTFLWDTGDEYQSSWVEFYRAVRDTLDQKGYLPSQDQLVTC